MTIREQQRQTFNASALRVAKQLEKYYIKSVYRALKGQISSFINDLQSGGKEYAHSRLRSNVADPVMAKVIKRIHKGAGLRSAIKTRNQLGVKKKGFGFNERMVREIQEYFRIFLLEKAVLPISATTKDRIETVLNEAIREGWGVDRIIEELKGEVFGDMTRRRARMIVRTEVVRASNFGSMAAAYDSDYEIVKTWREVHDARTRHSHRGTTGVGGQKRDLLVPFSNGGQFPGDPELPAGETVNCRCKVTFRLKRDEHGNPIPKKQVMISGRIPQQSLANVLAFGFGVLLGNLINEIIE